MQYWLPDPKKRPGIIPSLALRSGRTLSYVIAEFVLSNNSDGFFRWLAEQKPATLLTLAGTLSDPYKCIQFFWCARHPILNRFYCPEYDFIDQDLGKWLYDDLLLPHDMPVCVLGLLSTPNPHATELISRLLGGPTNALSELNRLQAFFAKCIDDKSLESTRHSHNIRLLSYPTKVEAAREQLARLIEKDSLFDTTASTLDQSAFPQPPKANTIKRL